MVLVICILAYLIVLAYNKQQEEKEAEAEDTSITVLNVDTDYLQSFSYQVDGEELSFVKDGDEWYYADDETVNIDSDAVEEMLSYVQTISAVNSFSDYESLSDYGFDDPANRITLSTASSDITVYLGDYNTMLDEYYLYVEGDQTVYLTDSTLETQFSATLEDLTAEEEETEETEAAEGISETLDGTEME